MSEQDWRSRALAAEAELAELRAASQKWIERGAPINTDLVAERALCDRLARILTLITDQMIIRGPDIEESLADYSKSREEKT